MYLLVGLGNPGERYARTRHNAGFLVVDTLARATRVRFRRQGRAHVAGVDLEGTKVLLAKPETYMNASGLAVADLMHRYEVGCDRLLVVVDDLDLPLGTLRLRESGGSGGHHGLDSIIAALGTKDFARLRLGIGRPDCDTVDYVLSRLDLGEKRTFDAAVVRAAAAVRSYVRDGLPKAMSQFNHPPDTT